MSGTGHFDLFVSKRVIERVDEYIHDRYDVCAAESDYYVRIVVENAVEEWCDDDPHAESEALVRNTVDTLGGGDDEETARSFSNSSVATDAKTRFARDVRTSIEQLFTEDFEARAPESDTKGEYLSRILLEFVTDGRCDRLRRKLQQVELYARVKRGDASSVEQKVAGIRSELADKFDNGYPVRRDELIAAVTTQPQTTTNKTRAKLVRKVLDHDTVEYVESPTTPDVFLPREQVRRNMEQLGLPGILAGPKYDRLQADYEFADLSKADKIEGIKVALVRLAMDTELDGRYRLTAEQIRERVFGSAESVRVDTIRRYMNEILEAEGFTATNVEGTGAKAVRVDVPTIIKTDVDLLENANLAKEYDYEDAPNDGLVVDISRVFAAETDGETECVEQDDIRAELDRLCSAQPENAVPSAN